MVSGGTYGTEEIIHGAGYGQGILILLLLPVLWCLPTAFMIGELSSALPQEGGYYAWVRRGLGNFWGFQEAWLSLAASIFDMAIYPTLFVFYLKQMSPWFGLGNHGIYAGLFVVVTCALLNLAGIRVVGITSLWLFFLLSAPFALIVVMAPLKIGALAQVHNAPGATGLGLLGGVLVAMWNYMGWDNASTIAQEVERPQRTYPKAMIAAVVLVALTYVLPFVAVYLAGIPASTFGSDGAWAGVAGLVGGKFKGFEWLRFLIVLGGMMSAFGMFNALVLSYSRLPLGTGVQAAGNAGHYALRHKPHAGVRNAGGAADPRARVEARIPRSWWADRYDSRRRVAFAAPQPRDRGERARERARDQWAGFRNVDYCRRLRGVPGHWQTAQAPAATCTDRERGNHLTLIICLISDVAECCNPCRQGDGCRRERSSQIHPLLPRARTRWPPAR